ncbi:MAG: MucR family transcriptional regulator [Alphaproteobacteria bacterium]|nr:MucR family transcriptional regulator [Alphaproteobacteria bacterium]
MNDKANLIDMTAEIVSAYVGNNSVGSGDLPGIIQQVYMALNQASEGAAAPREEVLKPAVNPKKSVMPDFIICLEDGKKFKSLKRHLKTHYNLSPEEYRAKWGLPKDYPMVAPNYAEQRSRLAREMGLGQKGRGRKRR